MLKLTTATLVASVLVFARAATASVLTERAALYGNNCKGSGLCPANYIANECRAGMALIDRGATYTDQAQFSNGHCYIIYATNGAGPQPVSGQVIYDTANTILNDCQHSCGSYGTGNCDKCHVTLNFRD
ncbi:hypothetical protein OE88DRAFT_950256 [Heliocybe sulcata]|uniref:Uncharacterized protein n=1 Tax=Heliocybe sulcata TaxID=5364 RepID=A0A5C3NE23_9AGAM|nr:hypothetical protein OE88DRAFT_950256 [Heliocybe sulcata]